MIKGCSKRVIVVKDPESRLFEEAYFIIRPHTPADGDKTYLAEADRLLSCGTAETSPSHMTATMPDTVPRVSPIPVKRARKKHADGRWLPFLLGVLSGVILCGAVRVFTLL